MNGRQKPLVKLFYFFSVLLLPHSLQSQVAKVRNSISLACKPDNDLYISLKKNKLACTRYTTATEAIDSAVPGSGILILADGYPEKMTALPVTLLERAHTKRLRLYIEYPAGLPGIKMGAPHATVLERVVVVSEAIKNLDRMQLLILHGCHYLPVSVNNPLLVAARVAGYDRAVYGLDSASNPQAILFRANDGELLVATTKLSQFITARYAPKTSIQALWAYILQWVAGGDNPVSMPDWTPAVLPSYTREEKLPRNATVLAVQRGLDWYSNAKMILSEQGWQEYERLWNLNDSNRLTTVASVNNTAPPPRSPVGDGTYGVLEGITSQVHLDGTQPARWWLRSDVNGESALAFALRSELDGNKRSRLIAGNLLDWVYFRSGLLQQDPARANYGLLFWAPGNAQALYQDNDVKAILGCIGTAAVLRSDRWNEVLVKNILGNFRTTGFNGFRGWRLENPDLLREGWRAYRDRNTIQLQPHYEAWTWASYLWLYDKTKWKPLLEKTSKGIRRMMAAYPHDWRWTNGLQQERGRMLLALSWLIRVDDRPEYRAWLKQIAADIEKCQDNSGAIREELGALDHGDMAPPASNAAYGTGEAPLIQKNGDPLADLLYTCNFTFLGLHEAYAATGESQYKKMADRLADFLIRVQVRSKNHKEVDGGWFRAFNYQQWEYLGSDADAGWGAWSIEAGWTQAWIPTVLALRELRTSLWDVSRNSQVEKRFENIRRQMIPDEGLENQKP